MKATEFNLFAHTKKLKIWPGLSTNNIKMIDNPLHQMKAAFLCCGISTDWVLELQHHVSAYTRSGLIASRAWMSIIMF